MGDHARVYPGDRREWRRNRGPRPWPVVIGFVQVIIGAFTLSQGRMPPLGFVQLLVGPAILLMGYRRWPGWAVVGVNAVALGFFATTDTIGPAIPSIVAAVINAVVHGKRIHAWASLGALWAGTVMFDYWQSRTFEPGRIASGLVLAMLLAGLAELVENRRQRAIVYRKLWDEERRRREEQRERQAGEERLRIARELHDVLAHSLSLITVRASVALELMDSNPQEVRQALLAIKQASKSGLDEVRTVLYGLRQDAPRTPAPDLTRLEDLVAQAKTAGLTVTVTHTGKQSDIQAAAGLAGYRIIQEALTNVIRHSLARTALVHVHDAGWALLIGISDPGPARTKPNEDGTGSGLVGIKERAASLGGTVEAGPAPGGGFQMFVALPIAKEPK
ncbi:MAG TPA: sensor histidine kinase [Candidatus Limnocylindrales bacterium]